MPDTFDSLSICCKACCVQQQIQASGVWPIVLEADIAGRRPDGPTSRVRLGAYLYRSLSLSLSLCLSVSLAVRL